MSTFSGFSLMSILGGFRITSSVSSEGTTNKSNRGLSEGFKKRQLHAHLVGLHAKCLECTRTCVSVIVV